MFKFLDKLKLWQFILLAVAVIPLAIVSYGRAATILLLSLSPAYAEQLDILRMKFLFYLISLALLIFVEVVLIVKIRRHSSINRLH